jgi:hypothetical protein
MRRKICVGLGCTAILFCCGIFVFPQQVSMTALAGGRGGNPFTDSVPAAGARVAEVRISAGDTIDSIQMIYALANGQVVPGPRHGGRGGNPASISLDVNEYIVALTGRYGDTIDSLSIITNRRQSQIFGGRGGDRDFRIEVPTGNQAIGFTGRAGDTIDAIGLVYTQVSRRRSVFGAGQPSSGQLEQTQLAGGRGGQPFADLDIPSGARIVEIRVRAGDTIDAIQAIYQLADRSLVEANRYGGGGGRLYSYRFDADEYLVALGGRYGDTVDSLYIITNKRQSQVFGGRGGDRDFRIEVPSGSQAVGFAGRAGDTVDAIGLVYDQNATRNDAYATKGFPSGQIGRMGQPGQTQMAGGGTSRIFTDQDIPAGAKIIEVRVRAGDGIEAIQAVYETASGRTVESTLHGGSGSTGGFGGFGTRGRGSRQATFRLDSDEYIVALAGSSSINGINSLSIITNKRQSQVFGGRGGTRDFRVEVPQGNQAIGFTGRAGNTIEAIGLLYDQSSRRRTAAGTISVPGQSSSGQLGQTQMAGGRGGREFADQDIPSGARLAEIRVHAGITISAIQAVYTTANGRYLESALHGGGGGRLYTFRFDSDEYLVALVGRYGDTIDSLSIVTNKRQSQVFGGRGGNRDFRIEVPQGSRAIGFAGRAGDTIDAIGLVYARTGFRH